MIGGALHQWLVAGGITAFLEQLPDFSGSLQTVVGVAPGADALLGGATGNLYDVATQIRARADDLLAAQDGADAAVARLQAAKDQTLTWTDPRDAGNTATYRIDRVRLVQRPTWIASPGPGEIVTCNLTVSVGT